MLLPAISSRATASTLSIYPKRVIDNTSASPMAGTFSNLPDGGTFTSNDNTYQVSYERGDGNNLTLIVPP